MTSTPNLGLELISASQSQKEVTFANAMNRVDSLLHGKCVSTYWSNPPTTPSEGDAYIVNTSPTGAWAGQAGKIAYFAGGGWYFVSPKLGMRIQATDNAAQFYYDGSAWVLDSRNILTSTKTANYSVLLTDNGKIVPISSSGGTREIRLPPSDLALNGFNIKIKVLAAGNNITVLPAQNRLLYSEDGFNAAWTKSNSTITSGATAGPLFGRLADKIAENTATSTHEISQTYSKAAGITKLTASVYFKASERTEAYLLVDDNGSTNRTTVKANLSNGTLNVQTGGGTFTLDSSTIENVGNSWYRVTAFVTVPTGSATIRVSLRLYDGTAASYTGVSGNGCFFFGAMLSEGVTNGVYTKTVATAVNETIEGASSLTYSTLYDGDELVCTGTGWILGNLYPRTWGDF